MSCLKYPVKMGDYKTIIKSGDAKTAFIDRNVTIQSINNAIRALKNLLSKEQVTRSMCKKFQDLEVKADTLVATLDIMNEAFIAAAMQLSGTIHADIEFLTDQDSIEKICDDIVEHVIKFQEVLESKDLLPPVPIVDSNPPASDPALVRIFGEARGFS